MKKILSLCLFLAFAVFAHAQEEPAPYFYPVIDGKVMYEKVVETPGLSKPNILLNTLEWAKKTSNKIDLNSDNSDIGQYIFKVQTEVGSLLVDFNMQIDAKDDKYRYRVFNIKHTVKGTSSNNLFAKYLVNVPAETDIAIVKGELKGYSKGQKKEAQKTIYLVEGAVKDVISEIDAIMNKKPKKAEEF